MKYLLYEKGGCIKKYPLDKPQVLIGRSSVCNIRLADPLVSKEHCRIDVFPDYIQIVDLGSLNGTYIEQDRISEARIVLNNSFGVGDTEFFFKQGEIDEFKVSRELSGLLSGLSHAKRQKESHLSDTRGSDKKYRKILQDLMARAIGNEDFASFLEDAREIIMPVIPGGSLFLLHQQQLYCFSNHLRLSEEEVQSLDREGAARVEARVSICGRTLYCRWHGATGGEIGLLHLHDPQEAAVPAHLAYFLAKLVEIIGFNLKIVPAVSLATAPALFTGGGFAIIGSSPAMKRLVELATRIAPREGFVLILGESGTGKEMITRLLHQLSGRRKMLAINCAAIPANLLESELFGHEAGAFTDARQRKIGKIEEASGGTLVLDEIADMPLEVQAKLLRTIQERSVVRLGGSRSIPVDLRIISMTNRDIYRLVDEGKFRSDLFFRLRVHELIVPPLRERREDIPALITHFTRLYAEKNGVTPRGFSEGVHQFFIDYPWPGNIRELENEVVKIMDIIDDGELIGMHHVTPSIVARSGIKDRALREAADLPYREKIADFERRSLQELLEKHDHNKTRAARAIGINYHGLQKKLKKAGLA